VLLALRDIVAVVPEKTVVAFLGDNIYPAGLPPVGDIGRDAAEQALRAQLTAAGLAQALFVPGNHDWGDHSTEGSAAIRRQATWLSEHPRAQVSPQAGCAGPGVHDLNGVRLVTLDTEWWFQEQANLSGCALSEAEAFGAALQEAIAPENGAPVVVVGHHPLRSRGPHGGFFTLADWIYPSRLAFGRWRRIIPPLPGLGPASRWIQRGKQDLGSVEYSGLKRRIVNAFATRPPLVYASGHEHSLQVFEGGAAASLLLVSGAGSTSNTTSVGHDATTLFAHEHAGFMVLDVMSDHALLRVIEPGSQRVRYWREVPLSR